MRNVVESAISLRLTEDHPMFSQVLPAASVGRRINGFRRARRTSRTESVKIDLPDSDRMFPDGPGSDAINNNCLAVTQPACVEPAALSKQAWRGSRQDDQRLQAPVAAEDVGPIVDYLAASRREIEDAAKPIPEQKSTQ